MNEKELREKLEQEKEDLLTEYNNFLGFVAGFINRWKKNAGEVDFQSLKDLVIDMNSLVEENEASQQKIYRDLECLHEGWPTEDELKENPELANRFHDEQMKGSNDPSRRSFSDLKSRSRSEQALAHIEWREEG